MGEVGPPDTFPHTVPHTFPGTSTTLDTGTFNPGGPESGTSVGFSFPGGPSKFTSTDSDASTTPTSSATTPNDSSSTTPPPTSLSTSSSDSMTSSIPSTSSASTGIPANSSGNDPSPISTITKHGLSGGSIAGLILGLFALFALLGGLFYLWNRRRRARARGGGGTGTGLGLLDSGGNGNGKFSRFAAGPTAALFGAGLGRRGGDREDAYTEAKPRSRPTSRYVIPQSTSTPFVPTATDLLPRHHHNSTQSVGTVVSDIAHTHESHGTLAGADDDAYLEKLEDAEANIGGSVTSGTTLTHNEPFLAYDAPALPVSSKARDTKNRRSTGDAMVIVDHNYGSYSTESQSPPSIPRKRSKSQELSRGGDVTPPSPTTYPPVPVPGMNASQPTTPVSPTPAPRASASQRKMPRKKPVPRYSEEASRANVNASGPRREGSASPPAGGALPAEFEGKPVHYLIPDMPAPQR